MKKFNWPLVLIVLVLGLVIIVALVNLNNSPIPKPPTTTLLPVAGHKVTGLPRVLIFSERNAFKLNYLEENLKGLADLQAVNIADEPELTGYYSINSFPAVLIISPAGKIVYKHEGALVNTEIVRQVVALNKG